MHSVLRLRALAKLAEDLQPINRQIGQLEFDMRVREKELEEMTLPNDIQVKVADALYDTKKSIGALLFILDSHVI